MDETAKLSLQEIQAIEFSMLEFLDSVCVEEGIEYCLFYGSALGAVRHGGFIPWDDDIDVAIKGRIARDSSAPLSKTQTTDIAFYAPSILLITGIRTPRWSIAALPSSNQRTCR